MAITIVSRQNGKTFSYPAPEALNHSRAHISGKGKINVIFSPLSEKVTSVITDKLLKYHYLLGKDTFDGRTRLQSPHSRSRAIRHPARGPGRIYYRHSTTVRCHNSVTHTDWSLRKRGSFAYPEFFPREQTS